MTCLFRCTSTFQTASQCLAIVGHGATGRGGGEEDGVGVGFVNGGPRRPSPINSFWSIWRAPATQEDAEQDGATAAAHEEVTANGLRLAEGVLEAGTGRKTVIIVQHLVFRCIGLLLLRGFHCCRCMVEMHCREKREKQESHAVFYSGTVCEEETLLAGDSRPGGIFPGNCLDQRQAALTSYEYKTVALVGRQRPVATVPLGRDKPLRCTANQRKESLLWGEAGRAY